MLMGTVAVLNAPATKRSVRLQSALRMLYANEPQKLSRSFNGSMSSQCKTYPKVLMFLLFFVYSIRIEMFPQNANFYYFLMGFNDPANTMLQIASTNVQQALIQIAVA